MAKWTMTPSGVAINLDCTFLVGIEYDAFADAWYLHATSTGGSTSYPLGAFKSEQAAREWIDAEIRGVRTA